MNNIVKSFDNDDFEDYSSRIEREVERRSIKSSSKQSKQAAKREEQRAAKLIREQNKLARRESKEIKKTEKKIQQFALREEVEDKHFDRLEYQAKRIPKIQSRKAKKGVLAKLKPIFKKADEFYSRVSEELKHSRQLNKQKVLGAQSEIREITEEYRLRQELAEARSIISAQQSEIERLTDDSFEQREKLETISFEELDRLEREANEKDRIIIAQREELRRLRAELEEQDRQEREEQDRQEREEQDRQQRELESQQQQLPEAATEERARIQRERTNFNTNQTGVGGIPGIQGKAPGVFIEGGTYQGKDSIPLDSKTRLQWNEELGHYEFEGDNQGLKFTFFAAEMSYPKEGFNVPHALYSQTILQRQVFYERPVKGKRDDDLAQLGYSFGGRVPMQTIIDIFNDRGGIYTMVQQKSIFDEPPKADFRQAYKNWRYLYEQGTYYRSETGELYAVVYHRDEKSMGNPPTERTAGRDRPNQGINKGDKIKVKSEEAFRWIKNRKLR